ncbi:MAG: AlpA family transcriptional regulator [Caulobacteraceae bacterium]|nr:AlpA family transcriptional regulator [Caulobacteraceae bacterium]
MSQAHAAPEPLISWPELKPMIGGVSRSTWWRSIKRGDAPAPIFVTLQRKAWRQSDILAWQASRSEAA